MSSAIYFRIFGQAVILSLHGLNSLYMGVAMENKELLKDPQINTMVSMQSMYITVWNIGFQLSYFFLAFVCDLLTVTGRDHLIPKSIKNFRQLYFGSTIWTVGLFIFTLFWPIFIVNRELLFPAFIDKIFPFGSNMVMHFCILPAVVWELVFLPRGVPKSHVRNVVLISVLYVFYNSIVIFNYSRRGIWPYPIMALLYGTVFFPLFLLAAYCLVLWSYFMQWRLTAVVWGNDKLIAKSK
ncbi:androgen-dependent TFPI-regulating protein-like [Anticarsia gemmatalis]|uniref:androgen-dependent TFPI-regulating protein-like n=1 Tax=Anticarsia gemmatalis TaxID=129554 RepID=UPI003F76AB6F